MKRNFLIMCAIFTLLLPFCSVVDSYVYDSGESTLISVGRSGVDSSILLIGRDTARDSSMLLGSAAPAAPGTVNEGAIVTAANYKYYAKIPITNSCTYAVTIRPTIAFPAFALVNGNYIQADADDLTVLYNSEERLTAMDLTHNDAEWSLEQVTIPANTTIVKTIYWGNSTLTRDQWWIADADDNNYASDSNSLDINTDLTISANIYIPSEPDSEQVIVKKEGAYEVLINTTPEIVFNIYATGGAAYTSSGSLSAVISSTLITN